MKLKIVKHKVQDQEWEHVVALGTVGMSHKCIAAEVYGSIKDEEPSVSSLHRVAYILHMEETKVTDYRNGRNPTGRSMICAIRREANILEAIRKATGQTVAALKKASA